MKKYKKASDKWWAVANGAGENGYVDCVLCTKHYNPNGDWSNPCGGCPIRKDTGHRCCADTPYVEWTKHQNNKHPGLEPHRVVCDECQRLALNFWLYLKSIGQ